MIIRLVETVEISNEELQIMRQLELPSSKGYLIGLKDVDSIAGLVRKGIVNTTRSHPDSSFTRHTNAKALNPKKPMFRSYLTLRGRVILDKANNYNGGL